MATKQLGVEAWLNALGLQEYLPMFRRFAGVQDLLNLKEGDLKNLGVRNGAHRARIVSSLVMLREKLHKGRPPGSRGHTPGTSPNHSNPTSPPSLYSHPDYANPSPSKAVNYPDYVPIQIPFQPTQQTQQTLGYIQLMPSPTEGPTSGSQELYKYLWYHGNIPRQKTERLLINDGDFLVRDSTSQPGDYVLSCCWRGSPLHFVINRMITTEDTGNTKVQYQFEDVVFNRVSELVQHYIANRKSISELSGAVIANPINRTVHLEGFDPTRGMAGDVSRSGSMKFSGIMSPGSKSSGNSPKASPRASPYASPICTPTHSPPVARRLILPKRTGSQPFIGGDEPRYEKGALVTRRGSAPIGSQNGQQKSPGQVSGSSSSLSSFSSASSPRKNRSPNTSIRSTSSSLNEDGIKTPPPKPSRIPTVKYLDKRPVIGIRNAALYEDDGKDYTDYEQVKSWPAALERERTKNEDDKCDMSERKEVKGKDEKKDTETDTGSGSDNDYDNNFDIASKMVGEADYDMPRPGKGEVVPPVEGSDELYDVPKEAKRVSDSDKSGAGSDPQNYSLEQDSNIVDEEEEFSEPTKLPKYVIKLPVLEDIDSCIDVLNFVSGNLPPENKPLEGATMSTIKTLFIDADAKALAEHITKVDLDFIKVIGHHDHGAGVFSGLELMTLPQGSQLRQDIMERYRCMEKFVAVTILICSKYPERAQMVHQWIQIANELRASLGNLFGFSAVMAGLKAPQVMRLRNTWISLKHNFAGSAFLYEGKLLNGLRSMDEGGSGLPLQNVTIPHIMPLIQLLERDLDDITTLLSWEESKVDYGFDILLAHLDTARIITEQYGLYRVTGENILRDFTPDRNILDVFMTELHLKLLWGAKGAIVTPMERYNKFEQLLTILSERAEPSQIDPETSL